MALDKKVSRLATGFLRDDPLPQNPDVQPWKVKPARPDPAHDPEFRDAYNAIEQRKIDKDRASLARYEAERHEHERERRADRAALLEKYGLTEAEAVRSLELWNRSR